MEFTETVQEYRKAKKSAVSAHSSVRSCRMVHKNSNNNLLNPLVLKDWELKLDFLTLFGA